MLTLLAVVSAFGLLGFMIALDATARAVIEAARLDRLYVNSRFDAPNGLPLGMEQQIQTIQGVSGVGAFRWVFGYHQVPTNSAGVFTVDEGMRTAWSEAPLSPAQWDKLFASPTGVFATKTAADRWGLHAGDHFSIFDKTDLRADGATGWTFEVLGVLPDMPDWSAGVLIGNYRYVENARHPSTRGRVVGFRVAVKDPSKAPSIARSIDQSFANSGTPTITVPARENAESQAHSGVAMASMTWGVGTAGFFMIVFLTGSSIAQSVRRRKTEFATLKAIGFTDATVMGMLFVEAAIPCCLGAILGTSLAAGMAALPRRYIPRDLLSIPQPSVSVAVLEWTFALALLIACIGTMVPVRSLLRIRVAAALDGTHS